jgi:hypothetical protein
MATSDKDMNRGAAPPHESFSGARGLTTLLNLVLGAKRHSSENCEMGGAVTLVGRRFVNRHNNQPKVGCSGGGGISDETRPSGTCGEDFFCRLGVAYGATKK